MLYTQYSTEQVRSLKTKYVNPDGTLKRNLKGFILGENKPEFMSCIISVEAMEGSRIRFPRNSSSVHNAEDFIATFNERKLKIIQFKVKSIAGFNTGKIITRSFLKDSGNEVVCDLTTLHKNAKPIQYAYDLRSKSLVLPNMIKGSVAEYSFFLNVADIILYAIHTEKLV